MGEIKSYDELIHLLQEKPGWHQMNAKKMTIEACIEMARHRMPIPGWDVIRKIIGKGSATDINEGKKIALIKLAEMLDSFGGTALPQEAVHVFENMWLAAINTASKRFEREKTFLNNQLVEFQVQLEQVLNEKMMLENTLKEQQNISQVVQEKLTSAQDIIQERDITIKEQKAVIAALENAIESERSNNEKLHEKHTFELNKSVERLNGMQKHMLSQVEAARLEANLRIQAESDKFKANENSWAREKMMLESSYFKTKQELEQAQQQIMCFQKELKDLQAWRDKADQSNPVKRLRRKISRPPFNQSIKTFRRLDK